MSNPPDQATALRAALVAVRDMKGRLRAREREPIAIVGIGCRFPGGGDGPDGYWRMLCDGVDGVAPIPPDRFDMDAVYDPDPSVPGKSYCRQAALLAEVRGFDAGFFNISPREAVTMDPQQRLLLEVAWEALEHAGIAADRLAGSRTGLFIGTMNQDYDRLVRASADPADLDAYVGTGTGTSFLAGRLSYVLGVTGPAMAVDTACSSSALAVHLACQSLRNGECDLALAGAANLILVPDTFVTMARLKALAADGRCKTFDASADGYGRGEGAGMVALKRLSDARAAGDSIIAVIAGSAVNHGGAAAGLTVPSGSAQQAVIRAALAQAEMEPHAVTYVEAHGTGTSLGDPIEIAALAAVQQGRTTPLHVGTVKTNIGHLEAAAGIAATIKVALMIRHGRIPPHLHFIRPNPALDLGAVPAEVPVRLTDWQGPRVAGVSAFGMSGTNVHLVIRADDALAPVVEAAAGPQLLALSARDDAALSALCGHMAAALSAPDAPALADAAWTLATGRARLEKRLAVVADDMADAVTRLTVGDGQHGTAAAGGRTRVAFLFSGQGTQYAGMAAGLYREEPLFRATVDRCLAAMADLPDLADMWLGGGDDPRLNDTAYAQPALFALQAGLVALWRGLGVEPDLVLGHSVGEFAAAWAAGVLGLEDAARLVVARGRLMQALPRDGAMIAVFAPAADLAGLTGDRVGIAGLNGAAETVLSGDAAALDAIAAGLSARGIRCKKLAVSHAFHSPLMDPAVVPFAALAGTVAAGAPSLPWVSTLTGLPVTVVPDGAYWGRQIREPVAFAPALGALAGRRIGCVIEIGPGPALVALARRELPDAAITWLSSLRPGGQDRRRFLECVAGAWSAGVAVRLEALHVAGGRRPVPLPTYPFQRVRHWITEPLAALPPLLGVAWEPIEPPAGMMPAGSWLVVPDRGGVAAALAAAGLEMECVTPGELAGRRMVDIAGVLHLSALDLPPRAGTGDLRPVLEGALALATVDVPALWVTRGAQGVVTSPAGATLWGLGRTAALERAEAAPVLLDLSDDADAAAVIRDLLPRLGVCRAAGERQWAWRGGWRAARLLPVAAASATPVTLRPDRSYLVTGATRGLGLAVARDLARLGAKHLLLLGRSDPDAGLLDELARGGVVAMPVRADITDADAVGQAIAATGAPPLAGIVHAAGLLRDGVLSGLDWDAFATVLAPKLDGLASLLALADGVELDFLTLFSSAAGTLGSAGQGNYAAANAWLDAAASALSADGRKVASIAWGPWRGLGMAADADGAAWARRGVRMLDPAAGLAAFVALAGWPGPVAVLPFDWQAWRAFDDTALLDRLAPRAVAVPATGDLAALLDQAPPGDRLRLAEREIGRVVRSVLRLGGEMAVDPDQPFSMFGMDSLMALELRAELVRRTGRPLPATLTYDHPTLAALARLIAGDLPSPAVVVKEPASSTLREKVASMDEAALADYVQRKLAARRGSTR
ncbi:type I polyketide synthase [Niveispirillum sp. KHB5.9]|uniref:type I polyketide synthase n=1 Tax=Niveispirillum sp. KHB5.9 TaxID=3400269 RepID=UPI003A848C01